MGEDNHEVPVPEHLQQQFDRLISELPPILEPIYPLGGANEATVLYSGDLKVSVQGEARELPGTLELVWTPTPALRYALVRQIGWDWLNKVVFDGAALAVDLPPSTKLDLAPLNARRSDNEAWRGTLRAMEVGTTEADLERVTFLLPNFIKTVGDATRIGRGSQATRVQGSGAGWTVTIDARPDYTRVIEDVQRTGGYVFTHIGELKRTDGSPFCVDDARSVLDGLYRLFSFANGAACGPTLPIGMAGGHLMWGRWGVPITAQQRFAGGGWLDPVHAKELAKVIPRFLEMWLDPYWRRVINIGVEYYVDALVPESVERAVTSAQVALELLVHAVLVDSQLKTTGEVEPISSGICRLLEHFKIPTAVPDNFGHLRSVASAEHWKTGPWAVTALRNEAIHVRRATAVRHWSVWTEAWRLATWYSEMCLLALFGFSGLYGNRLKWPRGVGEVESVPWA